MVPLRLLQELDEKKNTANAVLSGRAQTAITKMREARQKTRTESGEFEVKPGLFLFIPVEEASRERLPNADDEILRVAQSLGFPGLWIATGDYNMELRAEAMGLASIALPQDLRLESTDVLDRKIKKLTSENESLKNKSPRLSLQFAAGERYLTPPPPREDPREDAVSVLLNAIVKKVPPATEGRGFNSFLEPDVWAIREFNQERERWVERVREWAERELALERIRRRAIRLDLAMVNAGTATAEDVQVSVFPPEARIGFEFFTEEDLERTDVPVPPERPVAPIAIAPSRYRFPSYPPAIEFPQDPFQRGWVVGKHGSPRLRIAQVRHSDETEISFPLFVVDHRSMVFESGAVLLWRITSVQPSVTAEGKIEIRPLPKTV